MTDRGALVVSLDFELYWGVRDKLPLETYKDHLLGVRTAIPAMLSLFETYGVHATWATVGFLFFRSKEELLFCVPANKPAYENERLSPYAVLKDLGPDEKEDPFHYASSLLELIASTPHQRIGTHTFSHYYCLAPGQDVESFQDDLAAAIRIAEQRGIQIRSLIFPRNQTNEQYLEVCAEMGIDSYRGNPRSWLYQTNGDEEGFSLKRAMRLLDHYVNLTGHHCFSRKELPQNYPFNIPASRFLRPYSKKLRLLEPWRLRRICQSMSYAAKHGLVYHLWWHPHNFGVHVSENIQFLQKILDHYKQLQSQYGMQSLSMEDLSEEILAQTERAVHWQKRQQRGAVLHENSVVRS